jgi:hypothetical protein
VRHGMGTLVGGRTLRDHRLLVAPTHTPHHSNYRKGHLQETAGTPPLRCPEHSAAEQDEVERYPHARPADDERAKCCDNSYRCWKVMALSPSTDDRGEHRRAERGDHYPADEQAEEQYERHFGNGDRQGTWLRMAPLTRPIGMAG